MWKDNNSIDLRGIVWHCIDWIDLAWDRDQWRAQLIICGRIIIVLILAG
jgi:hypothetical protein